jgi:hypothetical protein
MATGLGEAGRLGGHGLAPTPVRRPWRTIALGASVIGLADLLAASAINGVAPPRVARAVAAGLLGPAARDGGSPAALLGVGLQVAMSILIAAIYVGLAARVPRLAARPWLAGLLYGIGIFVVMNFVVVPLSAIGRPPHFPSTGVMLLHLSAMLAYGVAVAWLAFARRG